MRETKTFFNATVITLLIFAFLLLTLGFYRNQWHAAGKKWFYDWKTNSDVMLVGRLVWSRQEGILTDGALLGLGDGQWPMTPQMVSHQYDTYTENEKFVNYWTYDSLIGGQGLVFSVIDQLTNFQPETNLKLLRGITSVLSALTMTLIVAWFSMEFNSLSTILVFGFCLLSEWFALYAGSLFFQLWAFYVPAIGVTLFLRQTTDKDNISAFKLIGISIATVVIKTFFNGFEFITPALGMMFVPIVYYSILRDWGITDIFKLSIKVAIGASIGIILSLAILSFQISTVTGSWIGALNYITYTFGKRTTGGSAAESMVGVTIWKVVWKYVAEGRALDLGNWLGPGFAWLRGALEIQYYQLFILFIIFSVVFILFSKTDKTSALYHKTLTLLYTTWFALLPSLSWFILFKEHSYIHTHLDYIVWQMPFVLFGFAFCGMSITYLVSLLGARQKNLKLNGL